MLTAYKNTKNTSFRKKQMKEPEKKYDITISSGSITGIEDQFSSKMTADNGCDPDLIAEHNFDAEVWKYADIGLRKGISPACCPVFRWHAL